MSKVVNILKSIGTYVFILLFSAFFGFPLFWMWVESFKTQTQSFSLGFIPWLQFNPTLMNWENELTAGNANASGYSGGMTGAGIGMGPQNIQGLINSTVVGIGTAIIAIVVGMMAAYALARYEFKRISNTGWLSYFLSLRFLPPIALAIPFYVFMMNIPIAVNFIPFSVSISHTGLLDTQLGLILCDGTAFLPYAILVLRDAFKSLPPAMEESAFVDGASVLKVLRSIALPLVAPALAAIFILTFSFSWNEFAFAFIFTGKFAFTMPIRLAATSTSMGVQFWVLSVRQIFTCLPPIILGLAVQKYIVSGLTMGAIKA